MTVAPNGSSAYVGHASAGVFSFDPTNPAAEDALARWVIATIYTRIGTGVSGLHHTSSLKNFVVMQEKTVHIVKILDKRGGIPLESGHLEAYKLNLDYHCDYLYSDANSIEIIFADTVIISNYAFVLG